MIDDGKVCMNCAFFDGFDSVCKAHPPAFAGYREEDGEQVREFVQPVIDRDWSESCGEWQVSDPGKSLEERRLEIHRAAVEDALHVEEADEGCWIPVNERLPEDDQRVLVWSQSNGLHIAYLDRRRQWRDADDNYGKKITHWMPLPEPPERLDET